MIVKFNESNRYYEIDNNGNVEKINVIIDKNPGDITKGINGEELLGTDKSPFEIWCIEDLIEWSQNHTEYKTAHIKLCQDLNFKSELSYSNIQSTEYANINEDEKDEVIIEEMQTGIGFIPIETFNGTFDGNNKELKNLYINSNKQYVGFFCYAENANIKNLKVSGNIKQYGRQATSLNNIGAILGFGSNTTIINCTNNAEVTGLDNAGGISGCLNGKIYFCKNFGNISGKRVVGGITGNGNTELINCINVGTVISTNYNSVGGINGGGYWSSNSKIYNCYNIGNISSIGDRSIYSASGGIFGYMENTAISLEIDNCYNIGEIESTWSKGSIIGAVRKITPVTNNCFYLEQNYAQEYNLTISCTEEYMKSQEFISKLNSYIESNEDGVDTKGWAKWIKGENGYPSLDFENTWNGTSWKY